MNADEFTRLGQRVFVCLLCSAVFISIFEPLLSYGIQIVGIPQSPFSLVGLLVTFTFVFYLFGYDDTVPHSSVSAT